MTVIKGIKWTVLVVVGLAVALTATVIALQEPIPPAGTAMTDNNRVYDESHAGTIAAARDELDAYRASLVSPSLSVAVGVAGELVWADTRGYADIESQSLATPDTIYAIGSVSKPFTGVLTTLLWQQGVLDIDADVRDYVPAFPYMDHTVTLRQLLSHQAGIRHYGLGWRIGGLVVTDDETGDEKIITLINHGGTRAGSTAILMIVPDHEIVVAMTANTVGRGGSGPITSTAAKVARQFIAARSR